MRVDDALNSDTIARYVGAAHALALPEDVREAARMCLVDWMAVCLGARSEQAGRTVRLVARNWRMPGRSTLLAGGRSGATVAALCNGTLAHCLDFDDTYVKANTHTSAPLWGATLALGEEVGASEEDMLTAFVVGFQVAARLGYGLGEAVTARGFHATGVFGRLGAAAACSVLLRLDEAAASHALGLAATQASGLVGSFGTMSKPFHAGKAAMDGVLSAQLASAGFEAATSLFEPRGGLSRAIIQDDTVTITPADFSGWEIFNNSFKPYAACHLTHPAIDAARSLALAAEELARVSRVQARIGALAYQITGDKSGSPKTALEGKFDVKYCLALALHGHALSASDFEEPFRPETDVLATAGKIEVLNSPAHGYSSAAVTVEFRNGEERLSEIAVAKGHPGNPMGWEDMRGKFEGLVGTGPETDRLFESLLQFGSGSGKALQVIGTLAEEADSANGANLKSGLRTPQREPIPG